MAELKKVRDQREKVSVELDSLRAEVQRLEGTRHSLLCDSTSPTEIDLSLTLSAVERKKIEMDIPGLTVQRQELEARLPQLFEAAKTNPKEEERIRELKKQMEVHEAAIAKAQKSASGMQAKIEEVQRRIDEAGGARLKAQRAKVPLSPRFRPCISLSLSLSPPCSCTGRFSSCKRAFPYLRAPATCMSL